MIICKDGTRLCGYAPPPELIAPRSIVFCTLRPRHGGNQHSCQSSIVELLLQEGYTYVPDDGDGHPEPPPKSTPLRRPPPRSSP